MDATTTHTARTLARYVIYHFYAAGDFGEREIPQRITDRLAEDLAAQLLATCEDWVSEWTPRLVNLGAVELAYAIAGLDAGVIRQRDLDRRYKAVREAA